MSQNEEEPDVVTCQDDRRRAPGGHAEAVRLEDTRTARYGRRGRDLPDPRALPEGGGVTVATVPVTPADLTRIVAPLVDRFWALHRPGQRRVSGHDGPVPILSSFVDVKRKTVGPYWALLSMWSPRAIFFAPELPLEAMRERFPFAPIRDLDEALAVLALHELGHYARGHSHKGGMDVEQRFRIEDEADALATVWLREGMTAGNVPINREPLCRCFFHAPVRKSRRAA